MTTVLIKAGSSLQSAIDANPAGTVFQLAAGTWHQQVIDPKDGDQFIGDPGGATILTGDNVTPELANNGAGTLGINVVFANITVENYMPGFQQGAISGVFGWTIQNCTFQYMGNSGNGIAPGHDSKIIGGHYLYNAGNGISSYLGNNLVVQGAEIAYNNTAHLNMDGDTGGMKITTSNNVQILDNDVHDNYGTGIWADVFDKNWVISGNTVTNNAYNGIHWELSDGVTIANNVIAGNGAGPAPMEGAAIYISSSGNANVYGNMVVAPNGADGIVLQTINRSGQVTAQNVTVHDNTVTFLGPNGENGWRNWGGSVGTGNSFEHNTYYLASATDAHFVWNNPTSVMTWTGWASRYDVIIDYSDRERPNSEVPKGPRR